MYEAVFHFTSDEMRAQFEAFDKIRTGAPKWYTFPKLAWWCHRRICRKRWSKRWMIRILNRWDSWIDSTRPILLKDQMAAEMRRAIDTSIVNAHTP